MLSICTDEWIHHNDGRQKNIDLLQQARLCLHVHQTMSSDHNCRYHNSHVSEMRLEREARNNSNTQFLLSLMNNTDMAPDKQMNA